MTTASVILTIVSALVAAGLLLYTLLNYKNLVPTRHGYPVPVGGTISLDKLALIERCTVNLEQVIVAADVVRDPAGSPLLVPVKVNFGRQVKYLFLVSKSRAAEELAGYYRVFEAYAQIELGPDATQSELKELIDIRELSYDWTTYPHVFYQARNSDGEKTTVAFRGNSLGVGYSDKYTRLGPEEAHTIATAILADAPVSLVQDDFAKHPELNLVHDEDVAVGGSAA